MEIQFSKYHGAGNDFIMLDDTSGKFRSLRKYSFDLWRQLVTKMCDRRSGIGADGVITVYRGSSKNRVLESVVKSTHNDAKEGDRPISRKITPEGTGLDSMPNSATETKKSSSKYTDWNDDGNGCSSDPGFTMIYFNPGGTQESLCGNGSRCTLFFAADVGLVPYNEESAFTVCTPKRNLKLKGKIVRINSEILRRNGETKPRNTNSIIRIAMPDVEAGVKCLSQLEYFVDTGSPHHVRIIQDVATLQSLNVEEEGRKIRFSGKYAQMGTNVNYISINNECGIIEIRTYESGVESETRACGTGAVAAAIVSIHRDLLSNRSETGSSKQPLPAENWNKTLTDRGHANRSAPSRELIRVVAARGGKLTVRVGKIDVISSDGMVAYRNIELEGPATKVFNGVYYFAKE